VSAGDLVAMAEALMRKAPLSLGGTRYVATALLLRQALEETLDTWWAFKGTPDMARVSARAQLIALPFYLDEELAASVTYAWYRLSDWCHHDAYELVPDPSELAAVAETVGRLVARTA
jgi:hypothetical protein